MVRHQRLGRHLALAHLLEQADSRPRRDRRQGRYSLAPQPWYRPSSPFRGGRRRVAWSTSRSPMRAAGAPAQRPMQGARMTRTEAGSASFCKVAKQCFGACQHATHRFANPDRQRRRRCFAFLDDVEMIIEGGNFVDFGLGQPHFVGQRAQMGGRQATVACPGSGAETRSAGPAGAALAQKRPDIGECTIIQARPLGPRSRRRRS